MYMVNEKTLGVKKWCAQKSLHAATKKYQLIWQCGQGLCDKLIMHFCDSCDKLIIFMRFVNSCSSNSILASDWPYYFTSGCIVTIYCDCMNLGATTISALLIDEAVFLGYSNWCSVYHTFLLQILYILGMYIL